MRPFVQIIGWQMLIKSPSGFTVIELMITLALAALIVTLGVPTYQGLVERSQLTSNINNLISSLALARSEAIKRKQRVVLCASNNGSTCTFTGYEFGWIVYVETVVPNSNRDVNNEELLWVGERLPNNMTLRGTGPFGNSIQYLASGRSGGGSSGSVRLCKDDSVNKARMLTIITSGRVHLAKNNSSGVPLKSNGDPIDDCATPS